jgi:hypothetical protein
MNTDFLDRAQADIYGRLLAAEAFSDVIVLSQAKGVVESDVETALTVFASQAGKLPGACVIVLMPDVDAIDSDSPGPLLEVAYTIRVLENPLVNREAGGTQKTAERLGLEVLRTLHHWSPRRPQCLYAEKDAMTPTEVPDGTVGYDIILHARNGLDQVAKAAKPVIAGTPADVTITTLTAGATIYYTLDGSFPYAGNAESTEYTIPFAVTSGTTVRAAAYKPGLQGSDGAAQTIT